MSLTKIIIGGMICMAAAFEGLTGGLVMGGFGICAVSFSAALLVQAVLIGAVFSSIIARLWPRAWWMGAMAFSTPALLGLTLALPMGEWDRVVGICVCALASFAAAFLVRYPSPGSLKS
jgi:hypothetical protein